MYTNRKNQNNMKIETTIAICRVINKRRVAGKTKDIDVINWLEHLKNIWINDHIHINRMINIIKKYPIT